MAIELATAYVNLVSSSKDLGKGIVKDLEGAGDTGGKRAGDKAGKSLLDRLGSVVKKGALAVGVAAGGLLATALAKGWGRLTNIENATAKLSGLGNSAQTVSSVMDNALKSVKGTAFGLDEAATTAAGVVAAGIKPGKELEGVLKTVADTATIAGKSMADTGAIFGSVAARGKLQGDDLLQLQSAGVPVLAMLAKHYGITAAAASQMVSKGEVDFKNFNAALQENLGGAALKSGQTTQGALKNMGAALGRFGAQLAGPVFGGAQKFFVAITNWIDGLGAKVEPVITRVSQSIKGAFEILVKGDFNPANWPGFEEDSPVIGFFFGLRDAALNTASLVVNANRRVLDSLASNSWGDAFKAIKLGLQGVTDDDALDGLSANLYTIGARTREAVQSAIPTVKTAAAQFWGALAEGEGGTTFAARVGTTLRSAGKQAAAIVGPAFEQTRTVLSSIWGKLADTGKRAFGPLMEIIGSLALAFGDAFKAISGSGLSIWSLLLKAVDGVASILQTYLVPALEAVARWMKDNRAVVAAVVTGLVAYKATMTAITIATKAWATITGIATAAQRLLNGAMKANPIGIVIALVAALVAGFIYLWNNSEGFRNFWIGLWNGIKKVVGAVVDWFKTYIVPIWKAEFEVLKAVFNAVKTAIGATIDAIKVVFNGFVDAGKAVVDGISAAFDWVKNIISGAVGVIREVLDSVAGWFSRLWDGIALLGETAWNTIVNTAKAVWDPIYDYIVTPISTAWDWVSDKLSTIAGWIGGAISAVGDAMKLAWDVAYDHIVSPILTAWDWVTDKLSTVAGWIGGAIGAVGTALKTAWDFVKDYIISPVSTAWDWVTDKLATVAGWIGTAVSAVGDALKAAWDFVYDYIVTPISTAWDFVRGVWDAAVQGLSRLITKVANAIKAAWDWVYDYIVTPVTKAVDAVKNAITGLKDWIVQQGAISGVGTSFDPLHKMGLRAAGGPVASGKPYIVGERGPELFVPSTSGRIVPNHELRSDPVGPAMTALDLSGLESRLDQMAEEYRRLPQRLVMTAQNAGVPLVLVGG